MTPPHIFDHSLTGPAQAALRARLDVLRAACESEALRRDAEERHARLLKSLAATAAATRVPPLVVTMTAAAVPSAPVARRPRNRAERRAALRRGR